MADGPSFADALFRVEHAKSHVQELDGMIAAYCKRKLYTVVRKPDPLYRTHYLDYLRRVEPLPRRIAAIAGDAITGLRAALDNAGFEIAVAVGARGKKAHFPFGDTLEEVRSRKSNLSKDIPVDIFERMVAFQPYRGGNTTLWTLNKLANMHKHTVLVEAVFEPFQLTYRSNGTVLTKSIVWDRTADEVEIAWIRRDDPHPEYQLEVAADIRFVPITEAGELGPEALRFLTDACSEVERVVLSLEAEWHRLGLKR